MALTRRQFLGRGGAVAGGVVGAGLFGHPFTRRAFAATLGDRFVVSVYLDGGNDGLNTVVPVDDGPSGALRSHYQTARNTGAGGLRLASGEILVPSGPPLVDPSTGATIGLHPGLAGLANLYALGKVAIVQGCGYPDPSLSHDTASTIWETADPTFSGVSTGWLGRHLAANFGPSDIPAVAVRGSIPGEFRQTTTSVLTVSRVRNFNYPYDNSNGSDSTFRRNALMALADESLASGQLVQAQVGAANKSTLLAADSYPGLHDLYEADRPSFDQMYDDLGTSTARDLREVAKVIHGVESGVPNVDARFFEVRNGGYDTHSDQGGGSPGDRHYDLHDEVGRAIETFYADCEDMGVADKLCLFVWSEFSRRIEQNDTGTDHGTQGPMFVVGGAVNGGVYGNHPDIAPASLHDGNTVYSQDPTHPHRSTDIRDVYGTILKHWVNVPHGTILSDLLPVDVGSSNEWWTAENFDMGFL